MTELSETGYHLYDELQAYGVPEDEQAEIKKTGGLDPSKIAFRGLSYGYDVLKSQIEQRDAQQARKRIETEARRNLPKAA